ncbi:MAG TPA: hypothetical protein VGN26_04965 [Armatimonadota bacterium]
MAIYDKTEIALKEEFNPKSCERRLNGETMVMHCHHYMSLCTQLADDCGMVDGKALLAESSEDVFHGILKRYYEAQGVTALADRIAIAEQYYAVAGLGQLKVTCAGSDSGEVELPYSHVDEGWVRKFGRREAPVNFVTQGYVAGLFAALFDESPRPYLVLETQSIVSGAECSRFEVVVR